MSLIQTRRRFLTTLSMAGTAGFVGAPCLAAAEGSLETTSIRLPKSAAKFSPKSISPRATASIGAVVGLGRSM